MKTNRPALGGRQTAGGLAAPLVALLVAAFVVGGCRGSDNTVGIVLETTPTSSTTNPVDEPVDTETEDSAQTSTTTQAPAAEPLDPVLELVAEGFDQPIWIGTRPGDRRLLIAEQSGRIRLLTNSELVLDISDQVSRANEQGLLGVAFSDDRMFVNYTDRSGTSTISEFDAASPTTETVLVTYSQPASNHNGGGLEIGPDGLLWVGTGDGGRSNDAFGNGQNPQTLLGSMLRFDVSSPGIATPAGGFDGGDESVWAIGLRNPWRYTFDGSALVIADVGQNAWEEISVVNWQSDNLNFGWPILEGTNCFESCDSDGLILPAIEYSHSEGCSVTGGVVYRGSMLDQLDGTYLYSDYCSGWVRGADLVESGVEIGESGGQFDLANDRELFSDVGRITSFGTDADGEVYITEHGGAVFRLTGV